MCLKKVAKKVKKSDKKWKNFVKKIFFLKNTFLKNPNILFHFF